MRCCYSHGHMYLRGKVIGYRTLTNLCGIYCMYCECPLSEDFDDFIIAKLLFCLKILRIVWVTIVAITQQRDVQFAEWFVLLLSRRRNTAGAVMSCKHMSTRKTVTFHFMRTVSEKFVLFLFNLSHTVYGQMACLWCPLQTMTFTVILYAHTWILSVFSVCVCTCHLIFNFTMYNA